MSASLTLKLENLGAEISSSMALHGIDLAAEAGQITAIIGPNGAGKTSLLRAICGELELNSGVVQLAGHTMDNWRATDRARVLAILPQKTILEFPFTVTEVVMLGRIPHSTSNQRNLEIVRAALTMVDCEQLKDRSYVSLSGGEKQRVQLARVIAQIWEPQQQCKRCLILDEPTSSLDLSHQAMIIDMMRFFANQGVTVLTVMHDLNLASKCAHQILVLEAGREVACGTPDEVLKKDMLASVFNIDAHISTSAADGSRLIVT